MQFYYMTDGEKFKNAWWGENMDFEGPIICPKFPGHQRPGRRQNPLRICFKSSKIGDVMWTWFSECVITEKVANLLQSSGLTGYRLDPVIVTGIEGGSVEKLPKMWELTIIGKGGSVIKNNNIEIKKKCNFCNHVVYTDHEDGLVIDESQWDGSDLFTVWPLPKYIIVTQKGKDFIKKNKIHNLRFVKVEKLKGEGKEGGLAPGSYDDWLQNIK